MATYCVTFRISDRTIDGKTYDDRRQSIIDAVYTNNGYWEETTSFLLVNSSLDTFSFTKKAAQGLNASYDMLVAFDPGDMSVGYFGAIRQPDVLTSFFRTVKKLP